MGACGQGKAGAGAALLDRLAGHWALVREIEDRRAGSRGRFEGVAEFAPEAGPGAGPGAGELGYRERGALHLPGQPAFVAERRYLWRADGDRVIVAFDDGRPFHAFDARQRRPGAGHDCPPDRYDVAYDFAEWPEWRALWTVRGPRKDYLLRGLYRRA
jgi:hypothetical protein